MKLIYCLFAVSLIAARTVTAESFWIGTWAAAPLRAEQAHVDKVRIGEAERTIRQTIRISQGGSEVRISFTNEFGLLPLQIKNVHVAIQKSKDTIDPASDHAVTFDNLTNITIAPGGYVTSDPIKMTAPPLSSLEVSVVLPEQKIDGITFHGTAVSSTYIATGDHAQDPSIPVAEVTHSWYFLKNIQVKKEKGSAAIVAIGDSITDGSFSEYDVNHRWTDRLAERLVHNRGTKHLSVMNAGIGGNRLLHNYIGQRALDRFDRDVLSAPGVKYIVLLEGINDIGFTGKPRGKGDQITIEELIAAMKQLIDRAHAKGLEIFGATLTPYEGARYSTPEGEQMRQTMNAFIRKSGNFDGVIDFDKAVRDPGNSTALFAKYDHGDHLHPSDAGYIAMGDAIDLSLFSVNPQKANKSGD
ncbi:SGNH/GDSL hydrolase family protein [Edaphobacter albus]|uniref:SGNH/GDSL hydrolase family protein n=1 Tax=Edaphobacter sp. 4G125 TaxID=2763071 RepID=UPI00164730BD|nr:SGNH/GDSL hydrolase family protein [Edaphobacter sp. 4G125]QNI37686.1 SGNH/GDSL hydrolase family protein [Edaphobacter sp. 4G125]